MTLPGEAPLVTQLTQLANIEDDWDSYGGKAPTSAAITALVDYFVEHREAEPDLTPINDGGIEIEWPSGNVVVVRPDGTIGPPD